MLIVSFSPSAEGDLEQIENYITENRDSNVAASVIDQILGRCNALGEMPKMGKSRVEIAPEVRSVTSGNYVILLPHPQ